MRGRVSLDLATELGRRVEGLDQAVGKALMAGLIHVAGGAYVWEHGLFRQHLIEGLSATEAAALHAVAAEALGRTSIAKGVREERAYHLRACRQVPRGLRGDARRGPLEPPARAERVITTAG